MSEPTVRECPRGAPNIIVIKNNSNGLDRCYYVLPVLTQAMFSMLRGTCWWCYKNIWKMFRNWTRHSVYPRCYCFVIFNRHHFVIQFYSITMEIAQIYKLGDFIAFYKKFVHLLANYMNFWTFRFANNAQISTIFTMHVGISTDDGIFYYIYHWQ